MVDERRQQLLYITSPSYSGSTLLTLLLAQHPEIVTIGEVKATSRGDIEEYFCSCGELMLECPFWKELQAIFKRQSLELDLVDFQTHFTSRKWLWRKILGAQVRGSAFEALRMFLLQWMPGLRVEYAQRMDRNFQFMSSISKLSGRKIFLDGSKDVNRLRYFLDDPRWDVRVIEIIRDGRAQSNSHRQRHHVSFKEAVKEWRSTILQMRRTLKNVPVENVFSLSYESLCADPNKVMNNIFGYYDLPLMDQDWTNVDLKHTEHHILGNDMRTKQHIRIQLDEKWRSEVSASELLIFEKFAGRLNRSLGKELDAEY